MRDRRRSTPQTGAVTDDLAGVVLAAGAGTRLAPLTRLRPKALCPVAGTALLDRAIDRLAPHVGEVAVNLHHGASQVEAHLDRRPGPPVHRSLELPVALGTAGALGALRPWLADRAVLLTNADAWFGPELDLGSFVAGWDGERARLLCVHDPGRGDLGPLRYCGVALLPAAQVARFEAVPSGLYEVSWRDEQAVGRLDLVATDARFVDCGTPADYLAANLAATGGASAIDPSARVGPGASIEASVLWPGAEVAPGEVLRRAVRTPEVTVLVRAVAR